MREFENYGYLWNCLGKVRGLGLGVPACGVVRYLGVVGLAKAEWPRGVEVVDGRDAGLAGMLRMLEVYTKISS